MKGFLFVDFVFCYKAWADGSIRKGQNNAWLDKLAELLYGRQGSVLTSWENLKQRLSEAFAHSSIATNYLSVLLTVQFSSYVCYYSDVSSEPNVIQNVLRFCVRYDEIYYTHLTNQHSTITELTCVHRSKTTERQYIAYEYIGSPLNSGRAV